MQLSSLNLNQLVALDALLAELHVGRAAARMGVTQSAMSHTLRGLRELMHDPLLVRVGNSMVRTPFAEEIQGQLRRGLRDLESVVSGRAAFDPSTITDTFSVATHDGIAAGMAAPLFAALRRRAPGAGLRIQPIDAADPIRQLGSGGADLLLIPPVMSLDGLSAERGRATVPAVVCRARHPVIKKKLSLAQFCRVPHLVISVSGDGPSWLDHLLAEHGKSRTVAVRVPYLMAAAEVVSDSDLLMVVPDMVGDYLSSLWPLRKHSFPLAIEPSELHMAWHPRFDADPPHLFFREVVREAMDFVMAADGPSYAHTAAMRKSAARD